MDSHGSSLDCPSAGLAGANGRRKEVKLSQHWLAKLWIFMLSDNTCDSHPFERKLNFCQKASHAQGIMKEQSWLEEK